MALKQYSIKVTKGMNQDLSKQIASPDTAYKLLNIKNQILDSQSAEALLMRKELGSFKCIIIINMRAN